jgi:hypothetical protein
VKKRKEKVCKGEGGALRAGGDDVCSLAAIVGKGRTRDESTVLVRVPG